MFLGKNDFQAALSQVENEELIAQVIMGARGHEEQGKHDVKIQENEDDVSWEQIAVVFALGRVIIHGRI